MDIEGRRRALQRLQGDAMSKKREYMMAPFRELDHDIRERYFAIPEGKRSDALRDAFRLWCGIDKKLVYEATEKSIKQPARPPYIQKGVGVHGNSVHNTGTRRP